MGENSAGDRLFANTTTAENFYLRVSMIAGNRLGKKEDALIFLDEIQAYPHLLTLLKFLPQDDRYTYIAGGLPLSVTRAEVSALPTGSIRRMRMLPLDFEEFLYANGRNELAVSALRRKFERLESLDEPTHNKMTDLYRKYLLVGGMPDAVNAYLASKNIMSVREIQGEIHDCYAVSPTASSMGRESILSIRVLKVLPSFSLQGCKVYCILCLISRIKYWNSSSASAAGTTISQFSMYLQTAASMALDDMRWPCMGMKMSMLLRFPQTEFTAEQTAEINLNLLF